MVKKIACLNFLLYLCRIFFQNKKQTKLLINQLTYIHNPMKKTLLPMIIIVCWLCSIQTYAAAGLNPFAYDLSSVYDPSTFTLTINYSLNAPATSVDLVIIDSNGEEAGRIALPGITQGTFSSVAVDLSTVGLGNGEYSWKLDVTCDARHANYEPIGRVQQLQSPFSVDVDNNPNSPYFGRIYVTQPTNNTTRGIYVYKPGFTAAIGNYLGNGITVDPNSWFTGTHVVPYRVRVLQDGTGRILATSCDRDQSTHLWLVNPADMKNWTTVITSANLRDWTNHNNKSDKFANTSLDIRKSDDGQNWELLLYSASVNSNSGDCSAGYVYSGIYTVPITTNDFTGGTYTNITKATDNTINSTYTGSMLNANAQFDKYGGVLYASYTLQSPNLNSSSLIHKTKSGVFKTSYTDGTYLYRQYVATGAIRFNHDFTRLAIAQGRSTQEALFYTVTQAQASEHIALSNRQPVDMILSTINNNNNAYVLDFAWDYAQNVYAVVRTSPSNGVYAMAANLGGKPVSTPAKAEYKFTVECPDRTWTVNVSGQVDEKPINTDLDGCALQIGGQPAAWNTTQPVQACTEISVKVIKDNKHKFIGWYNGETLLTKEEEYSFYAVKDINLVAKFVFAEYNVTWHNLLKSTTDPSNIDVDTRDELWELFMPIYNDYTYEKRGNYTRAKQTLDVTGLLTWFAVDNENHYTSLYNAMTNDDSPFIWLRDFIISVAGKPTSIGTQNIAQEWVVELVGFFLQTQYTHKLYGTSADYSGITDQWTPYYKEYVCGLTKTMNYAAEMPISIDSYDPIKNASQIQATGNGRPYALPTWYVSNDVVANPNKLLAWRLNGTDGKIIHEVDDDIALYATWVDKHLDENDSKVDGASNEDVIKLMKNTNHTTETDNVTVTRRLQGGMCNTICLPFDVDLSSGTLTDVNGDTHNVTAYRLTSVTDATANTPTTLNFEEVTKLEAGVPYLIKPDANITADLKFTGVVRENISLETRTTNGGDKIIFHGVINPTFLNDPNTLIVVANNRLAQLSEAGEMAGLRGYFTINPTAIDAEDLQEQALNGRVYLSFNKPLTTSVPIAPEAEQPTTPKVEKIMRDGQIYIIRDGVTYTITGARVR